MIDKQKLLVVLGDGGHTAEIVQLVGLLGREYEYAYIVARTDRISQHKITIQGPMYQITLPRAKDDNAWGWRPGNSDGASHRWSGCFAGLGLMSFWDPVRL